MKLHVPARWAWVPGVDHGSPGISLDAISPTPGQAASVIFAFQHRLRESDVATFLWRPPASALNGWECQPSEIAQSLLVSATVASAEAGTVAEPGLYLAHGCRHDLEILSSEPLLTVLRQLQASPEPRDEAAHLHGPGSASTRFLASYDVDDLNGACWCGMALVEGFIYIVATPEETLTELILHEDGGDLFGLFYFRDDPGGVCCKLAKRKLDSKESEAVRAGMRRAKQLADSFGSYLGT